MFLSGESGVERYVQVTDAFDDAEQQSFAAADIRGAGEVLGASFAVVRSPAAACAGRSRVVAFGGTPSTGGRLGDHTGTEVGYPVCLGMHLGGQMLFCHSSLCVGVVLEWSCPKAR
jgi:hypothetical protein